MGLFEGTNEKKGGLETFDFFRILSGTQRNGTKRWSFHDYQDTTFSLHTRGGMRTGVPLRRMDTISFSRSMTEEKKHGWNNTRNWTGTQRRSCFGDISASWYIHAFFGDLEFSRLYMVFFTHSL